MLTTGDDRDTTSDGAGRSRGRGPLIAGAIVLALVALFVVDRVTSPAGDRVAVVGDSITFLTTGKLFEEFEGNYDVIGDAVLGARLSDMMPTAKELAAQSPRQVIIDLGTNDVLKSTPIEEAAGTLREMIGLFDSAKCIHVVNINTRMTMDGQPVPEPARALNEHIEKIASEDGRIDVIDWDGMVAGSVTDEFPAGTYIADTVHPSDEGGRALAGAMANALDRCGRPWHFW
jgi:lysophospholipase L1-like esterase